MSSDQYVLSDYINAFRRRLKVFSLVFIAVLGVAVALAFALPDVYRSTAEVRIDLKGPSVELLEPVALTNYADQYIRSLQQRALKNDNLKAWFDASDIYADEREDKTESELIGRIRGAVRIDMVTTTVVESAGRETNLITGFTASFDSSEPEWSRFIADRVAAAFLAEDRSIRTERAATTAEILQEQIEQKRAEIVDLEGNIAAFKEQNANMLPDLMALNMTVLDRTERELEVNQTEMRNLRTDKIFRSAQLEEIRRSSPAADRLAQLEEEYLRTVSIYGADHPDVIRIRRQVAALTGGGSGENTELAQLEAELAEARQKYTEEHPDVLSLRRRIATLTAQQETRPMGSDAETNPLYLQLSAQIHGIDSQLEGLEARSADLRAKQAETENLLARMPQVEREYLALERDLQTAQLAFDDLRRRLSQAQQTESFESGDRGARLELVRNASLPGRPTSPPRVMIVILGVFLAMTLGGGTAIGAEAVDTTIRGARDVRALLQAEPIVAIPIVQNSVSRSHARRRLVLTFGTLAVVIAVLAAIFSSY